MRPLIYSAFVGLLLFANIWASTGSTYAVPEFTYSGYFLANQTTDASLFYLYFEVAKPVSTTPLMLWLSGGPGCSSLIGAFYENGPYRVSSSHSLESFSDTWLGDVSLLYIDSPVGTGYSEIPSASAYATTVQEISNNLYSVLEQFFQKYPSLAQRPLYLAGEAYAAKILPVLANLFISNNKQIAGIVVGDGLVAPVDEALILSESAYNFGLIDNEQRLVVDGIANIAAKLASEGEWVESGQSREYILEYLYNSSAIATLLDIRRDSPYDYSDLEAYLNQDDVKKALGAEGNWTACSENVYKPLFSQLMQSSSQLYGQLLDAQVPVLLYQGQFDLLNGVSPTETWLLRLNWTGTEGMKQAFRHVWQEDDSTVGYVRQYGTLTQVIVRNSGMLVPHDQGSVSRKMIQHWLSGHFPLRGL